MFFCYAFVLLFVVNFLLFDFSAENIFCVSEVPNWNQP